VIGWHSPDGGVNGVYKEMIEKIVKEYPLIGTASVSFQCWNYFAKMISTLATIMKRLMNNVH